MSILSLIGDNGIVITEKKNLSVESALDLSCQSLVDSDKIEPRYVAAIKQKHRDIGAYYVLAPRIAMPHARPEDGVKEQSLQLTVFKNGVDLESKDNGDVYLAITLAAMDSDSHIQTIVALAELFQNDEDIEKIISAGSVSEIIDALKKY